MFSLKKDFDSENPFLNRVKQIREYEKKFGLSIESRNRWLRSIKRFTEKENEILDAGFLPFWLEGLLEKRNEFDLTYHRRCMIRKREIIEALWWARTMEMAEATRQLEELWQHENNG